MVLAASPRIERRNEREWSRTGKVSESLVTRLQPKQLSQLTYGICDRVCAVGGEFFAAAVAEGDGDAGEMVVMRAIYVIAGIMTVSFARRAASWPFSQRRESVLAMMRAFWLMVAFWFSSSSGSLPQMTSK